MSWSSDAHSDPETARRGQREGKERAKREKRMGMNKG
jgi:hypothetical protein